MVRAILTVSFLFLIRFCFSQQNPVALSDDIRLLTLRSAYSIDANFHTSVLPYVQAEFNFIDSVSVYDQFASKPFNHRMFSGNALNDTSGFSILCLPLIAAEPGFSSDTSFLNYGAGASLRLNGWNRFSLGGEVFSGLGSLPVYEGYYADSLGVLGGLDGAHPVSQGLAWTYYQGYIAFSPHRFFHIQTGIGKHFFGDGYRSLLLSDNAAAYPYLRLSTTFWRIKYINLFTWMKDTSDPTMERNKYVSAHYLNWNLTRRISLGIFESVVWQAKDTLRNRGFDVNYLNPFVFYRPVEYSLGSSDNALLGMNLKVSVNDHVHFYGQGILDEFLLKEVMADSGWWANKYGFQGGFRLIEPWVKGLYIQGEYNFVRPFTYSHGSVLQNYAHSGTPLAHPLGANFWEFYGRISYIYKRWKIDFRSTRSVFGRDPGIDSYGGDPFRSYRDRFQDYHNKTGQGVRNDLFQNNFRISWWLVPSTNLQIFAEYQGRRRWTEDAEWSDNFFRFGISSALWNHYRDY